MRVAWAAGVARVRATLDLEGGIVAACASLLLLPALFRGTHAVLGLPMVDGFGTQWFYWFVEHQLRNGGALTHADMLYHPYGKDIWSHTGANVLDALVAVPFRVLLGPTLGYNVFVVTALLASAWAMAAFAREVTGEMRGARLAALVTTFSVYVTSELVEGRPTQAILLLPCLYLRAGWRLGATPTVRGACLTGLWLALTGYQYWYYALFGGIAGLGLGVFQAVERWRADGPHAAGRVLAAWCIAALVAVTASFPLAGGLLLGAQAGGTEIPGLLDLTTWETDTLRFVDAEGVEVDLYTYQPLADTLGYLRGREGSDGNELLERARVGLPLGLLGLVILGRARRREAGRLVAIALPLLVVAAGPLVVVADDLNVRNVPYIVLTEALGVMRRLWWPGRGVGWVVLALVPAWAWCFARCLEAAGTRRWTAAGVAVLGLLPASRAGLLPLPAWDDVVPPVVRCLASGPPGAVIDVPQRTTQRRLYEQTRHHRPLLGGMLEDKATFVPEGTRALREGNGFLLELQDRARSNAARTEEPVRPEPAGRAELLALGFRYVVLRREVVDETRATGARRAAIRLRARRTEANVATLLGGPVASDAWTELYTLDGSGSPCGTQAQERATSPLPTEVNVWDLTTSDG